MRRSILPLAVLLALLVSVSAQAVSNRIFMSNNGNNSSDCANPLTPCLTFTGALAQVNLGGEIIAEATGGYGPLTITSSVTISGPLGVVIYSGGTVTVNAPSATVVLRGLTIDGTGASGSGINVLAVGALHVESCVITGFTGDGIRVAAGSNIYVKDTISRGNLTNGIRIGAPSGLASASIDNCRFEGNGGAGLLADDRGKVSAQDCVASGNLNGFVAILGELTAERCLAANNSDSGMRAAAGGTLRVSNSVVTNNSVGLYNFSYPVSFIFSRGNNTVVGNGTNLSVGIDILTPQ